MSQQNQVIVDDDLMLFARDQLTISLAKVSNKVYHSLKYTQYFPVVTLPGYEWENTFEVVEFDSFGIATVLADSANDGGEVGVVARRQRYPIKTLSDYTRIPWLLLQQARAKNIPIDSKYAQALIYGMEKKNNDIAYNGDVDYGLQGISVKYWVTAGAESETNVPSGVIKAKETIKMNNAVLFNSAFKKKVVKIIAIGKWCIAMP